MTILTYFFNEMKILTLIIFMISLNTFAQPSQNKLDPDFQIGLYALQPLPGSKGHQTGSLYEIKDDVEMVKGFVNASIPYRHWNRTDYPNWDYAGFVINYLKDMYKLTYSDSLISVIQSFTPPLYSSFINPPVSSVPEDDRKIDRNLDIRLFTNFIEKVLREEQRLVFELVEGDTTKFTEIMLDKRKRPLGGWYLDDEPLIRNHDIEIIESMSQIIRLVETKIYFESPILRKNGFQELEKYRQNRHLAFDADDLHDYYLSSRKEDAKFYYYNGLPKRLNKEKIYTVFNEDTYDVLMLDFYHDDIFFWNNIILEAKYEFYSQGLELPAIMPIIKGFKGQYDSKFLDYKLLLNLLLKYDIAGFWIYSWIDSLEKTVDLKENWDNEENNLKGSIKDLK